LPKKDEGIIGIKRGSWEREEKKIENKSG